MSEKITYMAKPTTYRDKYGRPKLSLYGKQIYCSTQATADILNFYEEKLMEYGYKFDGKSQGKERCIDNELITKDEAYSEGKCAYCPFECVNKGWG